jgi:hypothetical protein
VYHTGEDPVEERDQAGKHPEVIAEAVAVLEREVEDNELSPVRWR